MQTKPAFFRQADWLWVNGRLVPWSEATTSAFSHALHYGSGVFEGIRAYQTEKGPGIFRLQAHLDRLFESAAAYGIELPYSQKQLREAVFEVLEANSLEGNAYIRPICWFGPHDLGLTSRKWPVEIAVIAWQWDSLFGEEQSRSGIRVGISPWRKIHSSMLPSTAKGCGQYLNSMLAAQYVVKHGYDEALLLDIFGNIAEGPGENIFIVKDDKLLTNSHESSILMGITRDSVIAFSRDLAIPVEVRTLTLNDLVMAQEAFFTGTAVEIVSIRQIEDVLIGTQGPITRKIREIFEGVTRGQNRAYAHWVELTPTAQSEISPTLVA
jgi:branched-chain amino acid aminotransferase